MVHPHLIWANSPIFANFNTSLLTKIPFLSLKNPKNAQLVGGLPTPLKNMKVSWDQISQYMEK